MKEDGGPAFPVFCIKDGTEDGEKVVTIQGGMSLRDYFAAKALNGTLAGRLTPEAIFQSLNPDGTEVKRDCSSFEAACWAYDLADEMLKAREK